MMAMELGSGAQLRQHALKIITDIKTCSESSRKRELVKELTDLDVGRVPLSVEDILHEVVALQHKNETTDVKRGLVHFLRKILGISMDWEVLCRTIDWLQGMLLGRELPVILSIIQACPKLTQNIFTQALEKGSDPSLSSGWQDAWSKNIALLCSSIDIALDGPDGAITMYTAKLVEQCVLTLTNPSDTGASGLERHSLIPSNHPVFNAGRLHSISQGLVQKLIGMCNPELSLRGTSLIGIIKALGSIARLRAAFTGRIVPALLEMVASGKYQVASKCRGMPDADGVTVSISTALKEALVGALKNHDPTARVWRKRLVEGLKRLGAGQTAEQIVKQLDRQAEKERRAHRPEKQEQSHAKRLKVDRLHNQDEPAVELASGMPGKQLLEQKQEVHWHKTGSDHEGAKLVVTAVKEVHNEVCAKPVLPLIAQHDISEMAKPSLVPQKDVPGGANPAEVKIERDTNIAGKGSQNGGSAGGQALPKREENPFLNKRLDLTQVRAILGLLASIGQKKLLQGFVKNLDVRILADVVIANLKDLTPRAEMASEEVLPSSSSPPGSPVSPALISEDTKSEEDIPFVSTLPSSDQATGDESEMKGDPCLQESASEASSILHAPSVESDDPFVNTTNPAGIGDENVITDEVQNEDQPAEESSCDLEANGQPEIASDPDVVKEEEVEDDDISLDIEPDIRIKGIEVPENIEDVKIEPAEDIFVEDEAIDPVGDTDDKMNIDAGENGDEGEEEEEEEDEENDEMDDEGALGESIEAMDGVQRLALRPRALTTEQSECLMEQGISPLIHANVASNRHAAFSQGVLAKLAAVGSIEKGPGEVVLNHIVKTFPEKTARELAIKWLFSIFLDHGAPVPSEGNDAHPDLELDVQGGAACENATLNSAQNTCVGHYEEALSALLEQLSTKIEDPRDKSVTSFLLDLPALPVKPVCSFLKVLSSRGSLFSTLSLMTASKLMEERPPLQKTMLYLILELTTAIDEDTREKAIRLVKNKLHSDVEFASEIETFAIQSLDKLKDAKHDTKDLENGEDDIVMEENEYIEEDWERFCSLYMALCTRKKSLLRGLMEVYGATNNQGRNAICGNAPKLADAIGYNSTELLELIRDTPEGAGELLLLMLTVMPKRVPSPAVVQACQERFKAKNDVRFIVPALPGLAKRDALDMVPLLARLPIQEFSAAVLALIARPRLDESIEPSEVLVALNRAKMSEQGVKLVQLRSALDHCLRKLSDLFDREALAGALNKMVQLPSLPMLFMRMVLLSVVRERSLCAFVLGTLLTSSVVIDKIMNQKNQWRGYLMLMAQTVPWSYKHLLELPTQVMKSVLKESSQDYVMKFRKFVESSECDIRIPAETMAALMESAEEEVVADDQTGVSVSGGSSPQTVKESTCSAAGETAASNEESAANPGESNIGT